MAEIPAAEPGKPVSAAAYNALRDEVLRLRKITASAPLTVNNGPGGVAFGISERGGVIPFLVTQIAGSAGVNGSSACTFTYDVFDAQNDPTKARKLNGATPLALTGYGNGLRGLKAALAAGTMGDGYYDPKTRAWILRNVDERPAGEQDCA